MQVGMYSGLHSCLHACKQSRTQAIQRAGVQSAGAQAVQAVPIKKYFFKRKKKKKAILKDGIQTGQKESE